MTLQISIDRDACMGSGNCSFWAPGVFDLDPKISQAKRPDGFYGWRLSGPLANLSFSPAPTAGGVAAPVGTSPMRGFSPRGF